MPENLTQYSPTVENPQLKELQTTYRKLWETFPLESKVSVLSNPPPQRTGETVQGIIKSWTLNEPEMKVLLELRLSQQAGERNFRIDADRLGNTTFVNEVFSVKSHGKETPVLEIRKA